MSSVVSLREAFTNAVRFPVKQLENWNTESVRNIQRIFDNTDWFVNLTAGEPSPFPICWDISEVSYSWLEEVTCNSQEIGFDCECIETDLVEVLNSDCGEPRPPPCLGDIPEGGDDPLLDEETDEETSPVESTTESTVSSSSLTKSYMPTTMTTVLLIVWTSLVL